jgi:hypothetical protein
MLVFHMEHGEPLRVVPGSAAPPVNPGLRFFLGVLAARGRDLLQRDDGVLDLDRVLAEREFLLVEERVAPPMAV